MKVIKLNEVEKVKVNMEGAIGAFKQVPISKNDGSPNYSLRVFSLDPQGHTPYHEHPYEHLNYVISGHGALVDEEGEETLLKSGDFAMVLPNEKHQYRNKSDKDDFVMICGVPKKFE